VSDVRYDVYRDGAREVLLVGLSSARSDTAEDRGAASEIKYTDAKRDERLGD
jgi:hypothetical protein